MEDRRKAAWIGGAILVKGDVVSTQDLVIDVQVQGTSTAQAVLSLHSNPGRETRRLNKAMCHSEDVMFFSFQLSP